MSRCQFFRIVGWHSFKRCFLIYLRPLSSVQTSVVEKSPAHANRLGEYICRLSGVACGVYGDVFLRCPFSHEVSWMRS